MNHSALHALHQSSHAIFTVEGEWEIPAHYGNHLSEHTLLRNGAGLTDLSHRGKLTIAGADRVTYLQGLVSNDIAALHNGLGMYCAILTPKGKIASYFRIFGLDDTFLIDIDPDATTATYQLLKRYLLYGIKATLKNVTSTYGHLGLYGPQAKPLLTKACATPPPNLPLLHSARLSIADTTINIVHTNEYGTEGYELLIPDTATEHVWAHLQQVATTHTIKPFGLVGSDALEIARIETGTPRYGRELNEDAFPAEAGIEKYAVSFSKGCYMGQETVARIDTYGGVKRQLAAVTISGTTLPLAGTELHSENDSSKAAGRITSAIHSPTLDSIIGLAYLRTEYVEPETRLTITSNDTTQTVTVKTFPLSR